GREPCLCLLCPAEAGRTEGLGWCQCPCSGRRSRRSPACRYCSCPLPRRSAQCQKGNQVQEKAMQSEGLCSFLMTTGCHQKGFCASPEPLGLTLSISPSLFP